MPINNSDINIFININADTNIQPFLKCSKQSKNYYKYANNL